MAFVCTAAPFGFLVQIQVAGSATLTVVTIGHDDEEPLNYSAVLGFDSLPGGGRELFIQIVEANAETGHEELYWTGRGTRFISKPSDRADVLASILWALEGLVSGCGPDEFSWFTHDEEMPAKALVKFDAFRRVIEGCGYTVTSKRLQAGRKAWRAHRSAAR